ncbi:lipopolysaccharide kinase InaA family protein [Pseudomonas borbori]|uniref:Lipopolysaccharide kinase (Kdo/WaaP) family protein n=1 Tax=Pseudomonas borbori TaxID=289003 RepID=A0A1I5S602_9PSED|nr:lipopolysaccharide kinase InaA family protein [Pseudomonas borbori]SFP65666.1 Lipopolysaccharide kinase (Kdo/WaaP) family protein [Pseudomonas borbori]
MRTLSTTELDTLLRGAKTIEEDGLGLKVACLANGDFLKLYRRKRLLSSALWSLPARRFANNAKRLQQLGIASPDIEELLLIPERKLNGVRYRPLPGETLRDRWRTLTDEAREAEVQCFGAFLGHLHQLGVYFRSLHLGNVLYLPDTRFGLIDLSDMQVSGQPLPRWKRKRNVRHLLRYHEDAQWLASLHLAALIRGYASSAGEPAAHRLMHELNASQTAPLGASR